MMRFLLLLLCCAAAGLGLLTVIKAPDWVPWQAAVLAGEYGYWVALVPAAAVLATVFASGIRAGLIRLIGLIAVALLVQPCIQAWWIARTLPAQLEKAFGPVSSAKDAPAFSFSQLFGPAPKPAGFRTLHFAPDLDLDFYSAARTRAGSLLPPCVVVIHGGGWNNGERGQIATLNAHLADAGYAVADISYRLAPKAVWPAQRDDVFAALAYLKRHAAELGLDPRRFVLLGRSAGGQIAEAAGYAAHDSSIRGVAGLYAPADMYFAYRYGKEDDALKSPSLLRAFLGGPPVAAPAAYRSASAYLLAGPGSPPTLLVHGTLDALVWYKQSSRFAEKLQETGVPHYLLSLPWATHAVEYHPQGPGGQLTWFALDRFVSSVTK